MSQKRQMRTTHWVPIAYGHDHSGAGPVEARIISRGLMISWRGGPPALWGLRMLVHSQLLLTVLIKGLSVAIVWGLCRVFTPDTFDARLLGLGALLTAALHVRLPADLYAWEREQLAFRWNLPLGPGRRWREQVYPTVRDFIVKYGSGPLPAGTGAKAGKSAPRKTSRKTARKTRR